MDAQDRTGQDRTGQDRTGQDRTGPYTILVVHDSEDEIINLLRLFRKYQSEFKIVAVDDGVMALEYVFGTGRFAGRDTKDLPGFILLDLAAPRMTAFEFTGIVRAYRRTQPIPIIAMSEKSVPPVDWADGYLQKPVKPEALEEFLRKLTPTR